MLYNSNLLEEQAILQTAECALLPEQRRKPTGRIRRIF